MRFVPAKFTVLGRDYQIHPLPPQECEEMDGLHSPSENRIYISPDLNPQNTFATFGHEMMHCLFEAAGRLDLSADEGLCEVMGNLLAQALKTSRGKFKQKEGATKAPAEQKID